MDEHRLSFNGVDGATGSFGFQPTRQELTDLILGRGMPAVVTRERMPGVLPKHLESSGWGVLFAEDTDPAIKDALGPLLDHRKNVAARENPDFYREYVGTQGLWQGESKSRFLARHGAGPGPVNPKKVPYYLLIVGGPEKIPFRFQHQLGVQYAVGRVAFDTPAEYARYAQNVVEAESSAGPQTRRAAFFGVRNPDDAATRHSSQYLLEPLVETLSKDKPNWHVESWLADQATKDRLARLLGGEDRPTLLFTTSHGLKFKRDNPLQRGHAGALLCQDWPGPKAWTQKIPEDHYFAGHDVAAGADLRGMITFHFACYGAGVPEHDTFGHQDSKKPAVIAHEPFVARLPQRLLAHPRGALAVIGHVDRAWGFSFYWPEASQQPDPFEAVLKSLMDGEPVGYAMRYFGDRHGQLAADLSATLEDYRAGGDPDEIIDLWTATNDARSYAILGDPAVRLRVGDAE